MARGRNVVADKKFLGEGFRAFQLCGDPARAETAQAGAAKSVDDARDQRRFGADHGQCDIFHFCQLQQAVDVVHRHGHIAHARFGAVPALPGATTTSLTRGDWLIFQASACSRPPEPMTSTFMAQCRKWRTPVNTIAMPCSSAAAIDFGVAHRTAGLDHRTDARRGRRVDAVAEREERIRRHHAAGDLQLGFLGLERGDPAR